MTACSISNDSILGRINYNGGHYILSQSFTKPRTQEEEAFAAYNEVVKRLFSKLKDKDTLIGTEMYKRIKRTLLDDYSGELHVVMYIKHVLLSRIRFLYISEKVSEAKKLYDTLKDRYFHVLPYIWKFELSSCTRRDLYRQFKRFEKDNDYAKAFQYAENRGNFKYKDEKEFVVFKEYLERVGYRFESEQDDENLWLDLCRLKKNLIKRKDLFEKKVKLPLNKFNYFVTITYDDDKCTEEEFRRKLLKCLQNLHTRRGWLYAGVWERGTYNVDNERITVDGRLHYHAMMYIPDGQLAGEFHVVPKWNKKQGKIYNNNSHSLFSKRFGLNDFQPIDLSGRFDSLVNYVPKYINKTGEKIKYSRGIVSNVLKDVPKSEISSSYLVFGFLEKFVLYDDSELVIGTEGPVLITPRLRI